MINATILNAFSLSGLNDMTTKHRATLFSLAVLCYIVILLVNGSLIVLIILDEKLHEPMYIFLGNLCINSLYGTAAFYPKFLSDLLSNTHVISYTGCLLQVFVIYSYAATDFSVLTLMAYDRYVAICRPLEYHSVMTKHRAVLLVFFSRLVPLLCQTVVMTMTSTVELCGSHIEKLYCDNWSILKLSCSSITTNNIVGFIMIFFYFGHDLFIVCSYVQLVKSALKSRECRRKFMQTCVPHLLCLLTISVALLFDLMYARYGSSSVSQSVKDFMGIQFLMIPPVLNPIIYGLQLTQVRNSLLSLCKVSKQVKGLG
ncbi:putative gustatory receptor clone PTE01 [Epinephelus moara]|uniref:putative gustatory receptor clone PTE01 n=1 Tax=Epinephelus moara TaxID=300413 RepID=UPI00214E4B5B|nr:putative gustatory receptor clone PTE01 [Epinephelus moara]